MEGMLLLPVPLLFQLMLITLVRGSRPRMVQSQHSKEEPGVGEQELMLG